MQSGKKAADNAIDFNKIRKKRQRLTSFKRMVILFAIFGGVILVVVANRWMIEQGITTQLSDLVGGIGGSGYPVEVPGGVIRDVKAAGNHLAVLNDANLYVYNDKGKQTANFQAMTDSTVLITSQDRFLTFDVGARNFAVHSRTTTPFERELEYGILAGGMNEAGDFAIVSSSKQSICEITVFDSSFSDIYYCALAENLATAVSIAPRGDRMAVGWLNGRGGVLQSGVNIYQLSNAEGPIATLELAEDLILDVRFMEENRIGVLTDRRYLVMSADGEISSSYLFGDRQLSAFEAEGRQMLFLCQNEENRAWEVILLDEDCTERAVLATDEKVIDVALSSRRAYLLTDKGIQTYGLDLTLQEEAAVQFGTRIELVGSRLYYLSRDEIGVLGQTRAAPPAAAERPDRSTGPEPEPEPTDSETGKPAAEPESETEPGQTDPPTDPDPNQEPADEEDAL